MKAYLLSTNDGNASGPLIDVKDPSNVRNLRVAKPQIVLIPNLILILNLSLVK